MASGGKAGYLDAHTGALDIGMWATELNPQWPVDPTGDLGTLVTVETWILRIVALWVEFYLPQDLDMNLAYFFLFICLWQLQTSLSCIYNNLVVHQLSHSHKLTPSDVWPMSLTQDVHFKSAWYPVTCIACEICEKTSLILMNQRCRR